MNFTLNDKMYNLLKWIAQILLPAIGTLYFALSGIWNLPYGEEIIGTITAIDAFLGALLGLSSASYNKSEKDGILEIDTSKAEKDSYLLKIKTPLDELRSKQSITLKVNPNAQLYNTKYDYEISQE